MTPEVREVLEIELRDLLNRHGGLEGHLIFLGRQIEDTVRERDAIGARIAAVDAALAEG